MSVETFAIGVLLLGLAEHRRPRDAGHPQIRALETFDTAAVAQGAIASERTARIYACAPRERWSLGAASCAMAYESPMIFVNLTVNMDAAASPAAVL